MRTVCLIILFISCSAYAQEVVYSENVRNNYQRAITAYTNGNTSVAKDLFLNCVNEDSTCFEAYYGLAQIYFAEKAYDQAKNKGEVALKLRPYDSNLTGLLGRIYYHKADYAGAELFLKRAVSFDASDKDNQFYLALTFQKLGNYPSAFENLNSLIASAPLIAEYWLNRGLLFLENEDYANAQNDFKKSLSLADHPIENCYYYLAVTAFKLGNTNEGLTYIEEGLQTNNKEEKVMLLLLKGKHYHEQGQYQQAEELYEQAHDLENNNPTVIIHQAAVLIDLEMYEFAIQKCDEAIELNPNQKEAFFNRGIANEMIRDVEQACIDWQKAFILGSQKAIAYLNGPVCNE